MKKKAVIEALPAVKETKLRAVELVREPPAAEGKMPDLSEEKDMVMGSEG